LPEYSTDISQDYDLEWSKDQEDMEAEIYSIQFTGTDFELGMDDWSMESFGVQPIPAPNTLGNRD
jgi:hypothetical protein